MSHVSEQELRNYLAQNKITEILSELVEGLCFNRPVDAIAYMVDLLQKRKPKPVPTVPVMTFNPPTPKPVAPTTPAAAPVTSFFEHHDEDETDEYKELSSYNLDAAIRRGSIAYPQAFQFTLKSSDNTDTEPRDPTPEPEVQPEPEPAKPEPTPVFEQDADPESPRKPKNEKFLDTKTVDSIRRRYSVSHPRRKGFSNETTDELNSAEFDEYIPVKTEDEIVRLMSTLSNNVMFQHLDQEELSYLVQRGVRSVNFQLGETIISQGDEGDNFYIVDTGSCEIFVKDSEGNERLVSSVGAGGSFGELALIYGTPRAATVKASAENVRLWAIGRLTYRKILMDQTHKKRRLYESFLAKVPILQSLSGYERLTIADALQPQAFEAGEVIFRQGESGHAFYIIVDGTCEVTRVDDKGQKHVLATLCASDFFGELALLFNQPRAATVTAIGSVRLVKLDRKSFNRVIGPIEDILKRNMENYRNYMANKL